MTDKIYPVWVNDRLPTEEDADCFGRVLVFEDSNSMCSCVLRVIKKGYYWCRLPDTGKWHDDAPYIDYIATPQECIDREKGEEVEAGGGGLIKLQRKQMENDVNEARKKVKDLEEKLEKSEERVKKQYAKGETITGRFVTGETFEIQKSLSKSEERVNDLEQALEKSEERVKEFQKRQEEEVEALYGQTSMAHEYYEKADKLSKENQTLKKLLIKEWGG